MILAINANAAVDQVLFIDCFQAGSVMRTGQTVLSVGGKGLDTALVLHTLGAPVLAVSLIAGRNGETLARLLEEKGVEADLVWVPGETRFSNVIVERSLNRHSHITTSGYSITHSDGARFLERICLHAQQASWAVIAGSLPGGAPASFYREVIDQLHAQNVRVLIDCSGQPAREALAGHPEIFKMNQDEFAESFHVQAGSREEWIRACRVIRQEQGIPNLVITCGKDGILAFTGGAVYHASGPVLAEVNAAGSGDAVSAALAYRLSLEEGWEEALRWAVAAGSAVVLTEGTAECNIEDVLRIYPQVRVQVLPSQSER